MLRCIHTELGWLPPTGRDTATRLKALGREKMDPEWLATELLALAGTALDLNQLTRLAAALGRLNRADAVPGEFLKVRAAILSNATTDLLLPALEASALRHGIALEIIPTAYDQIVQGALDPDSAVNRARPDVVMFLCDHRTLPFAPGFGDRAGAESDVEQVMTFLRTLREGVRAGCGATCLFQTFPPPCEPLFGSTDAGIPGTLRNLLQEINRRLARDCLDNGELLLDVAALAETVGTSHWHDPQMWNFAKLPCAVDLIPLYAEHVTRVLGAWRGKSRRALILDLDNTLWGGVIGDDGLDGIKVAQGDPTGEAYLSVQRMALELRGRGVVLAVSSKNSDAVARQPFEAHPEMLLKLDHFAVFQANWDDKASNIRAIAKALNLGLDAMVFLDDNPVERGLVRQLLPQVAVPELPEEPALYARTLAAAGYFEAVALSAEDMARADFYHDNARRLALKQQEGGLAAYIASLDMEIGFAPFDATGRARIAQLINKSNQFNLTTRRYSETEVDAFATDTTIFTLQVRLRDAFGDNGMISVIIVRPEAEGIWEIDTWLMSCRVLGRGVEQMVLREIVAAARAAGISTVIGRFIPSGRNAMVADHYERLGFRAAERAENGATLWHLSIEAALPDPPVMRVVRAGWALSEPVPTT